MRRLQWSNTVLPSRPHPPLPPPYFLPIRPAPLRVRSRPLRSAREPCGFGRGFAAPSPCGFGRGFAASSPLGSSAPSPEDPAPAIRVPSERSDPFWSSRVQPSSQVQPSPAREPQVQPCPAREPQAPPNNQKNTTAFHRPHSGGPGRARPARVQPGRARPGRAQPGRAQSAPPRSQSPQPPQPPALALQNRHERTPARPGEREPEAARAPQTAASRPPRHRQPRETRGRSRATRELLESEPTRTASPARGDAGTGRRATRGGREGRGGG